VRVKDVLNLSLAYIFQDKTLHFLILGGMRDVADIIMLFH